MTRNMGLEYSHGQMENVILDNGVMVYNMVVVSSFTLMENENKGFGREDDFKNERLFYYLTLDFYLYVYKKINNDYLLHSINNCVKYSIHSRPLKFNIYPSNKY